MLLRSGVDKIFNDLIQSQVAFYYTYAVRQFDQEIVYTVYMDRYRIFRRLSIETCHILSSNQRLFHRDCT